MTNRFLQVLLSCVFSLPFCKALAQSWIPLGPSDSNKASFARVSNDAIAVYGDVPYVIFSDHSIGRKATIRKYSSQVWQTIGAGISSGATSYNDIAIDSAGNIYAAFCDEGNGLKASVRKYSGNGWATLGAAGLSVGHAHFIDVAVSNTGTPYVAFVDTAIGNMAVVKKWDGASWVDVGTNGIVSPAGSWYLSLAIDNSGNPLVAYGNPTNYGKMNVRRWNGSAWAMLGNADFSTGSTYNIRLVLKKDGTPYVSFTDNGINRNRIMRLKSGASSWTPVGLPHYSYGVADIAFDRNDTLHEALCDTGNNYTLALRRYSDTIFTRVLIENYVQMAGQHIVFDTSNRPLVTTLHMWSPSQENVVRYNGSDWDDLAGLGLTGRRSGASSVAIDGKGKPYLFSADFGPGAGTVWSYSGGTWNMVGTGPVTGPRLYYFSIAVDAHDVPYILYSELYQRLKVKKFDGTNWVLVGDTSQLTGGQDPGLAIDTAGTPYISYADPFLGGKPTVKKFDGTNWVPVGAPGFEVNQVLNTSLAIDKSGTPYITYSNTLGYLDVTVKKFNGAAWVNVGSPGVSAYYASMPQIALDTAGLPYVIFKDDNAGGRALVRRFNGTSWQNHGAYLSVTPIRNCAIAIDEDNSVYASYIDDANNYQTWVKKVLGGSSIWSTLGNEAVSCGMSGYSTGIVVKNGMPIVTWSNYGIYARQYTTSPPAPNDVPVVSPSGMSVQLHPNPTSGNINLSVHTASTAPVQIAIHDLLGRTVYYSAIPAVQATKILISSIEFAPGTYLVSVRQGGALSTLHFVKQ